ncbi:MAG: DUF1800 family protein [Crocinitomix sp.]|nr:DUF1800 family protein [Crocinitomix sp.]
MTKNLLTAAALLIGLSAFNQQQQFIGGGNSEGVSVSSSSDAKLYDGVFTATGENTINGAGLEAKQMEAVRFLSQATFGADPELTDYVAEIGIESWIDEQFAIQPNYLAPSINEIFQTTFETFLAEGGDSLDFTTRPNWVHLDYAWWDNTIKGKDLLRQRMAYALSEIVVISAESTLGSYGEALGVYYDILIENAFGNYRDILDDVTRNVAMGTYLSHLRNAKTDTVNNTNPDENYAREIMQLFSIGLYELNQDGTLKLDGDGNSIPTYNNEDIKEFAKVFTGFGIGGRIDTSEATFTNSIYIADVTLPMKMWDEKHEPGEKHLLNGYVIADGQTGDEDVSDALDHLFNHENVPPFIATRLIQHFVKSNPTPEYVSEISAVFIDNGAGIRGDLGAVLKAILLHPEARTCEWINDAAQGKLREPILRYTTVARHFGGFSPYDNRFWNYSYNFKSDVDQHPLHSPTVFNFFSPGFSPNGEISDAGLIAPVFEIHNSRTGINYANWVYYWVEYEYLLACRSSDVPEDNDNVVGTNMTRLYEYAKDADALLDQLDLFLCHGQLTERTRGIIKETLLEYPPTVTGLTERIQLASYLILISPDYNILK